MRRWCCAGWRVLRVVLVLLYLLVAVLNYSVVQSLVGAVAGNYFSQEWGGIVRIGALHINPLGQVEIDDLLLVSPTNDTIYDGELLTVGFRGIPVSSSGLSLGRVRLKNVRYHFASIRTSDSTSCTNLQYIIDYFATDTPPDTTPAAPFGVEVRELVLNNVNYIMDLPEPKGYQPPAHGVSIPHMRFWDIHGRFKNVHVINDSVTCRIVTLRTRENSGLDIQELSMDVEVSRHLIRATNLELQTADSRLFLDAELRYPGWEGMSDYLHMVQHDAVLKEGTVANLRDAAYWAPTLWGIDSRVTVTGHAHGTVADMFADDFVIHFGDESAVLLDGRITGLPNIRRTTLKADIHQLHTTYDDLMAVRHPGYVKIHFPKLLNEMQYIDLAATVDGGLTNLLFNMNLNSRIGDMVAQLSTRYDTIHNDFSYRGEVSSSMIGVSSVVPNEWLAQTGLRLQLQGHGLNPQTMEGTIEGQLFNSHFLGHDFQHTTLTCDISHGQAHAKVNVDDPYGSIDLDAIAQIPERQFHLDFDMEHVHLSDLGLLQSDSNVVLTASMTADIQADTNGHLSGNLQSSRLSSQIGSRTWNMKRLEASLAESCQGKDLAVHCDWFDLDMQGYLDFSHIPLMANDFCSRYIPAYYNRRSSSDTVDALKLLSDDFHLDFVWTDTNHTIAQLIPNLVVAPGTTMHGTYNSIDAFRLVVQSDYIGWGNVLLHDVGISSTPVGSNYLFRINSSHMDVSNQTMMEHLQLSLGAGRDISSVALTWDDGRQEAFNRGDLEFFLSSSPSGNRVMVARPSFYIAGYRWSFSCPNGVHFTDDHFDIGDLSLYGMGQSLTLNAHVGKHLGNDEFVKVSFKDFSVGQFLSYYIPTRQLKFEGTLDGLVQLYALHEAPYFDANLDINGMNVNDQRVGLMNIKTNYVVADSTLFLDITSNNEVENETRHPIELHGSMIVSKTKPQLDFILNLKNVAMRTVAPVLSEVSNNIGGHMSGALHLTGSLKSPRLDGNLKIGEGLIQLNSTGATYHFNDELVITDNQLSLHDFAVHDRFNNSAILNGGIAYNGRSLHLDLSLRTDGIIVVDKKADGKGFYGTVLASADGTVRGPVDSLDIKASATTLEESEIFVPVNNRLQAHQNDFVTFVTPRQENKMPIEEFKRPTHLSLLLNVTVTPDLKLHLPMDFSDLTANVSARGRGDVRISMKEGAPLNVLGNYDFASGNFSLTLVSLLSKSFVIEPGSTLNFPGEINNARFDISAVYNQRVNLSGLLGSSNSGNDSYEQVQNIIKLTGTAENPTIQFDIRLPNAEQSVQDQVFALINRQDERTMLNQSLSLLLLGTFQPVGNGSSNNNDGTGGLNILASSASTILSNMIKVVDVNLKYQAGTSNSNNQLDVGISKQWERFYFESTFGYGNATKRTDLQTNNNTLMGDVEVGFRFNPYVRFYAFHRNNTSYFSRNDLPYKQGLGFKISKDFDALSEFFAPRRKETDTTQSKKKEAQ